MTGRRRAEVINMKARDLSTEEGITYYTYRGKGGKRGRRELPQPALEAIQAELRAFGKDLTPIPPNESLWPSRSSTGIAPSGVHIFRHTAAKLRRDVGETIEDVSRFLDHSSLAVTTVYLRRLEGEQDRSWEKVAQVIGI
jgi:integrase